MSFQRLCSVLILGASLVAACSGDEPASVSEPDAHPQQASAKLVVREAQQQSPAQASTRKEKVDRAAESRAEPVGEEMPEQNAPPASSVVEEAAQEAEQAPRKASPALDQSEVENAESEPEEPPRSLTNVPATAVGDAEVRTRPGLAWQVVDRLELGAPVTALHQAGGWVRVRYGDGLAGWIRSTALDLGDIEESQILERAAPPLIAEWRGEEYGVMGQSADGAEFRLLQIEDETSRIIGAPINEVRLIDTDITLDDLPILIGDETVVFPGDDFRVGQGKILPRANEWMWLPWGWLLAHNDTHIWQWRPETDELEMIPRPPGYAKLSPDGRYLAIENLCSIPIDECGHEPYVIILPLDGSPPVSAVPELHHLGLDTDSVSRSVWLLGIQWSSDSKAVGVSVDVASAQGGGESTLVVHLDGRLVLFDETGSRVLKGLRCGFGSGFPGDSNHPWEMRGDVIGVYGSCRDEDGGRESGFITFSFDGEFLGVRDSSDWWISDRGAELIRAAEGGDRLSDYLQINWSDADRYALVVDLVFANAWIYDASLQLLHEVQFEADTLQPSRLWLAPELGSDARRFLLRADWHNNHVVAVTTERFVIRAAWLIDTTVNTGAVLDLGGLSFHNLSPRPERDWSQSGSTYYIFSEPSVRADGLSAGAGRIPNLLLFERSGDLKGAVNVASTCGDSIVSSWLRDRAEWSPDGELLAIGGIVRDGQRSCPD